MSEGGVEDDTDVEARPVTIVAVGDTDTLADVLALALGEGSGVPSVVTDGDALTDVEDEVLALALADGRPVTTVTEGEADRDADSDAEAEDDALALGDS